MKFDVATYQERIRAEFARLKGISDPADLARGAIELARGSGRLVPVCRLHQANVPLVRAMGRWREENADAFATRFPITVEGTARWIEGRVIETPDRILFLVVENSGRPVGYLGFANCFNKAGMMELVNHLMGETDVSPMLMIHARRALEDWARKRFGPRGFYGYILTDNERAIRFSLAMGMRKGRLIPLRKTQNGPFISYVPRPVGDTASPDKWFLRMIKFL